MVIQLLSVREEQLVRRVRKVNEALSTRPKKGTENDLYVPNHSRLFSDAYKVLDHVASDTHARETGKDLISLIVDSTRQLLHARNEGRRCETRYRAEAREHTDRFLAEAEYVINLADLAIETGAVNGWHNKTEYKRVLSAYTKMRSATIEFADYARRMKRGHGRGNVIFKEKANTAFQATVEFGKVLEDYFDAVYHAPWFDETAYGEEARLGQIKQVVFTPEARGYLPDSLFWSILDLETHGTEGRDAVFWAVRQDPNLLGRPINRRKFQVGVSEAYDPKQHAQTAPQPERADPKCDTPDVDLLAANMFQAASASGKYLDRYTIGAFR